MEQRENALEFLVYIHNHLVEIRLHGDREQLENLIVLVLELISVGFGR